MTNINPKNDIVIYHASGEWSAFYFKGKLETVGDTYRIWETLTSILQIEERYSDAFLLGGNGHHDVAKRLDAAEAYQLEIDKLKDKADAMDREARELEERAKDLRSRAKDTRNAV